jgi:hypothetical protein
VGEIIEAAIASSGPSGIAALLGQWSDEDATDDPKEIEARERDLEELKSALNANHSSLRKLFT